MLHRYWAFVLFGAMIVGGCFPASAAGAWPRALWFKPQPPEPRMRAVEPLRWYQPHEGALDVPTYRWGHFGVPPRTSSSHEHGYHNDYKQWTCRHGL